MPICKKCGDYILYERHTCKPEWKYYRPEYQDPEEAEVIYANDAEEAADLACGKKFSDWDHPTSFDIAVISPEGVETQFEVEVHPVPEFELSEKFINK